MPSPVVPVDLRAERDRQLYASLTTRTDVERAMEAIGRTRRPTAGRRHLLGNAIRLEPRAVPAVYEALRACLDAIELDQEVELYVSSDPSVQAHIFAPERRRAMLAVSSGALERLEHDELVCLIGHELGHLCLGHLDLPFEALRAEGLHPEVLLDLHAWSRAAEVSADRVSLACGGSLEAAAGLLFKLATGLARVERAGVVRMLEMQYDDLLAATGRRNEDALRIGHTHPLVPIRFHAMQAFASSAHMGGQMPVHDLEATTEAALALMEARYMTGDSDRAKAMRRLMFAAGIALADADGDIETAEIEALETLLDETIDHRMLDPKAIRAQLGEHVARVMDAGAHEVERNLLVRDLCLIALADDRDHPSEREILYEIAEGLGETAATVDAVMDRSFDLD